MRRKALRFSALPHYYDFLENKHQIDAYLLYRSDSGMTPARTHICADVVCIPLTPMSAPAFAGGATMRANFISALSLLLSGCIATTTSGTEEAVLFSGKEAPAGSAQVVLSPYKDLPLSIEFACPTRIATLMTFYVIPLPPVVPVGFVNEHVSYLRIRMPEGTENAIAQMRIVTPQGTAMPLSDARQSMRAVNNKDTVEATYAVNKECEALDGGVLEVAGFSYKNKTYPASEARLQFESRIKASVAWWPPSLFNGGHAASGGIDASRMPAQ
jgi:hypothetical protein